MESSVDFNTAVDSSSSENIAELLVTCSVGIFDGLVEHDHSTDVLLDVWGGEEKLSVSLSVGMVVLNVDALESLSNSSGRLIGGEDTLAWGANFLACFHELLFEGSTGVSVHMIFG